MHKSCVWRETVVLQDPELKKPQREGAAGWRQVDSVWGFQGGGPLSRCFGLFKPPVLSPQGWALSASLLPLPASWETSSSPLSSPSLLGHPSPCGSCSAPWPVSWGLWPGQGCAGGSGIPKGLRTGHTHRAGSKGRLVCVTWGPGWQIIKAGKCLTRSLLQGLEGWTLQGPSVAETPFGGDEQTGPGWGDATSCPILSFPSLWGLPWPPGREDSTPFSCGVPLPPPRLCPQSQSRALSGPRLPGPGSCSWWYRGVWKSWVGKAINQVITLDISSCLQRRTGRV